MILDLRLIETDRHGVVDAYAVVTDKGTGQDKAVVHFRVDDESAGKSMTTDSSGMASTTFTLPNGQHSVSAQLGGYPGVNDTDFVTIQPKQAGAFGTVMMLVFWFLVWLLGPGWLTLTYLGLTMGALSLIAKAKGVSFREVVGDNNWVFPSVLFMLVVSVIMHNLNPMLPEPFGAPVINLLRNLFGYESMRINNSVFWGIVNNLFFGEDWTYGWRDVAIVTYVLAIIPAIFISYTDEVVGVLKQAGASRKGEEWVPFLQKYLIMELLKVPFKAIFRGSGKK